MLGNPDFQALLSLAGDQIVLVNDMYSYRSEALGIRNMVGGNEDGQECFVFNAVCALLREDGVDETNVMDKLGAHISRKESDFIRAEERLTERYKDRTDDLDIIQKWVAYLKELMGGAHYWSTICGRYNKLDDILVANE
jgi:hypothetical protein